MGHIIDLNGRFSTYSPLYIAALAADTCWVTRYAWENSATPPWLHEFWADVFTLQRYRREVAPLTGTDRVCAAAQFAAVGTQTDAIIDAGYDITGTWAPPAGSVASTFIKKRNLC